METFFEPSNLHNMFMCICNNKKEQSFTSLCRLVLAMIQNPLQLHFSETGLVPFKDNGTLVYGYRYMNEKQKQFCIKCLRHKNMYNPKKNMNTKHMKCLQQFGGGVIVDRNDLLSKQVSNLCMDGVLSMFIKCIMLECQKHSFEVKRALCCICLQHISTTCTIPESIHLQINNLYKQHNTKKQKINLTNSETTV
jgi:hypothetical protein